MNRAGKIFISVSAIVFAIFFISLFTFNEVEGLIQKNEDLLLSKGSGRTGNGGGSGPTKISLISYTYQTSVNTFTGSTLRFYGGHREIYAPKPLKPEKIKVYYLKMAPSVSMVDRSTSFYAALILLLLGVGLLEISKWVKNLRTS